MCHFLLTNKNTMWFVKKAKYYKLTIVLALLQKGQVLAVPSIIILDKSCSCSLPHSVGGINMSGVTSKGEECSSVSKIDRINIRVKQ